MTPETPVTIDHELLRTRPLPSTDGDKSERGTVLVVGGARQTPGRGPARRRDRPAPRGRQGAGRDGTRHGGGGRRGPSRGLRRGAPDPRQRRAGRGWGRPRGRARGIGGRRARSAPGSVTPSAPISFSSQIIPRVDVDLVIDALGTAYLTGHLDGVRHLTGRVVLTPNATELAAMLERPEEDVEQDLLGAARELADQTGAVVLSGTGDLLRGVSWRRGLVLRRRTHGPGHGRLGGRQGRRRRRAGGSWCVARAGRDVGTVAARRRPASDSRESSRASSPAMSSRPSRTSWPVPRTEVWALRRHDASGATTS